MYRTGPDAADDPVGPTVGTCLRTNIPALQVVGDALRTDAHPIAGQSVGSQGLPLIGVPLAFPEERLPEQVVGVDRGDFSQLFDLGDIAVSDALKRHAEVVAECPSIVAAVTKGKTRREVGGGLADALRKGQFEAHQLNSPRLGRLLREKADGRAASVPSS